MCYKSLHINIGNQGDSFAHILCLYFGKFCKINKGNFLLKIHLGYMNYLSCSAFVVDVTLVCVFCIFQLFCTLHLIVINCFLFGIYITYGSHTLVTGTQSFMLREQQSSPKYALKLQIF